MMFNSEITQNVFVPGSHLGSPQKPPQHFYVKITFNVVMNNISM